MKEKRKLTAAHEALVICAKLYPWRAKVHLGNDTFAYVHYASKIGVVQNWSPRNDSKIPNLRYIERTLGI